jgi:hypothetical protein
MKLQCPHCRAKSMPLSGRLFASAAAPSRCPECGGLSHSNQGFSTLVTFLSQPALLAAVIGALWLHALWPLYALATFVIVSEFAPLLLPATPTTREKAARVRRFTNIGLVVFILLVIAAGVFYGP